MNKFRCLTPEELMKHFRDKTLFYPVNFSFDEKFSFMIETIETYPKTNTAEVTLVSLYFTINGTPVRYCVNQFELLQNWRFADDSPCGVKE